MQVRKSISLLFEIFSRKYHNFIIDLDKLDNKETEKLQTDSYCKHCVGVPKFVLSLP